MLPLYEMGSAMSEKYKECACGRVSLSEVVKFRGGVLFKNT